MRSRRQESVPEFLNEKDARKQAERQAMQDALSGPDDAVAIEWSGETARGDTVPTAGPARPMPPD